MPSFHWRSYHYASFKLLGEYILHELRLHERRGSAETVLGVVNELCENHLLSVREKAMSGGKQSRAGSIEAVESRFLQGRRANNVYTQKVQAYLLGYTYAEQRDLVCTFGKFDSIGTLTEYIKMVLKDHPDSMDSVSNELMCSVGRNEDEAITALPQYAAWLTILGKSDVLK